MPGKGTVALAALAPCLAGAVSWFGERSCTWVSDGKEPSSCSELLPSQQARPWTSVGLSHWIF